MTIADLDTWLDSVQCTAPFTLEDMGALLALVKQQVPSVLVDVFDVEGRGTTIRVSAGRYSRDISIT